jgi:hypothetical protein
MAEDFHKKADGLAPTVTFGKLNNDNTIAAFANRKWHSYGEGAPERDSECMLLNLTN